MNAITRGMCGSVEGGNKRFSSQFMLKWIKKTEREI